MVPDVSLTSIFIQSVTNCVFSYSVIDRGCAAAPYGTASVHLQLARQVTFDHVTINNTPETGKHDECAIDFETDVDGCIIKYCTFENNAGAALEFLANRSVAFDSAFSRNVEVYNSFFRNNNWAYKKPIPSQIQIVDERPNRPTGTIHDNNYINASGVLFFGGDGDLSGFNVYNNVEGYGTDQTSPSVDKINPLSATQIEVVFSEPVEKTSAEDVNHYSIDGGIGRPQSSILTSSNRVILTVSNLTPNLQYTLTVSSVSDNNENTMGIENKTFTYVVVIDSTPPQISSVSATSANTVIISFNEVLD